MDVGGTDSHCADYPQISDVKLDSKCDCHLITYHAVIGQQQLVMSRVVVVLLFCRFLIFPNAHVDVSLTYYIVGHVISISFISFFSLSRLPSFCFLVFHSSFILISIVYFIESYFQRSMYPYGQFHFNSIYRSQMYVLYDCMFCLLLCPSHVGIVSCVYCGCCTLILSLCHLFIMSVLFCTCPFVVCVV